MAAGYVCVAPGPSKKTILAELTVSPSSWSRSEADDFLKGWAVIVKTQASEERRMRRSIKLTSGIDTTGFPLRIPVAKADSDDYILEHRWRVNVAHPRHPGLATVRGTTGDHNRRQRKRGRFGNLGPSVVQVRDPHVVCDPN